MSDSLDATPVITGSVVNSSEFAKGGMVALDSFKPGPGAAANDDTDQLSVMLIRGIRDTLPASRARFSVQTGHQDDSEYILEGNIESYGREGHAARSKLGKNQVFLAIDGNIWLRETGEKIFLFQTSVIIDLKTQSPAAMAYQIGAAVARYIGSRSI